MPVGEWLPGRWRRWAGGQWKPPGSETVLKTAERGLAHAKLCTGAGMGCIRGRGRPAIVVVVVWWRAARGARVPMLMCPVPVWVLVPVCPVTVWVPVPVPMCLVPARVLVPVCPVQVPVPVPM